MADLLSKPAALAIALSMGFAAMSIAAALVMYLRRLIAERAAAGRAERDRRLSGDLIRASQSPDASPIVTLLAQSSASQRLRVLSHLLMLMKGDNQNALLMLADRLDVTAPMIAALRSRSIARRVDAMRAIEQIPTMAGIDALTGRLLNDPSMAVRTEAAVALARLDALPEPMTVSHALSLRNAAPMPVHGLILRVCAANHVEATMRLADDVRLGRIRPLVVEALGSSRDFAVLDALARHARSCDPALRIAALKAARRLGHPAAAIWVQPMLVDGDDNVRIHAIKACRTLNVHVAIPMLAALVESASWWVRTRAAEALGELRSRQSAPLKATGLRR